MELETLEWLIENLGIPVTFAIMFWWTTNRVTTSYIIRANKDDEFQLEQLNQFAKSLAGVQTTIQRVTLSFDATIKRLDERNERDFAYRESLKESVEGYLLESKTVLSSQTVALSGMTKVVADVKDASSQNVSSLMGIKAHLDEITGLLNTIHNGGQTEQAVGRIEQAVDRLSKDISKITKQVVTDSNKPVKEQSKDDKKSEEMNDVGSTTGTTKE